MLDCSPLQENCPNSFDCHRLVLIESRRVASLKCINMQVKRTKYLELKS